MKETLMLSMKEGFRVEDGKVTWKTKRRARGTSAALPIAKFGVDWLLSQEDKSKQKAIQTMAEFNILALLTQELLRSWELCS